MQDDEIKDRVRTVLVESLVLEGLDPQDILNDTPIQEELGLDSVDALELVLGLEKAFEIKIDSNGLSATNFQSVDTLAAFVKAQLEDSSKAS